MTAITQSPRLYQRRLPQLLADLAKEQVHFSDELYANIQNQHRVLNWWSKRRSDVMSLVVVEQIDSTDFIEQLTGLVGVENFARYRRYRNAHLYLVPTSANVHLVRMLSGILRFKEITNWELMGYRKVINGCPFAALPWENSESFGLYCASRFFHLNPSI